eukprot:6453354-Heterocapsa_arctica.AAC.1
MSPATRLLDKAAERWWAGVVSCSFIRCPPMVVMSLWMVANSQRPTVGASTPSLKMSRTAWLTTAVMAFR